MTAADAVDDHPLRLTIAIKALNEERHIEAALESALAAAAPFGGEVVLADSGSSDGTVAIARRLPARIVQLGNPAERRCGAGAQLAFQSARGDYFALIDGDMTVHADFIRQAIAYLDENPGVAGVGGVVTEKVIANAEFAIRAAALAIDADRKPGPTDRLDGGGVYRSAAIRDVGYFADRNLHAFEEFDLAARLAVRGWQLARIPVPSVDHYGHAASGYRMLWRRLRTGYAGGVGEAVRAAMGRPHLALVVRRLGHVRNSAAVILWWLALVACLVIGWQLAALALLLAPLALLWVRRGSLSLGAYSLAQWNVQALGLIGGLFARRRDPMAPLAVVELTPPPAV